VCGNLVNPIASSSTILVIGMEHYHFCGEACFIEHIEEIVVSKSEERLPVSSKCKSCGCDCDLEDEEIRYLITNNGEAIFCSSFCLKEHVNKDATVM
jgi:hypothetical protein